MYSPAVLSGVGLHVRRIISGTTAMFHTFINSEQPNPTEMPSYSRRFTTKSRKPNIVALLFMYQQSIRLLAEGHDNIPSVSSASFGLGTRPKVGAFLTPSLDWYQPNSTICFWLSSFPLLYLNSDLDKYGLKKSALDDNFAARSCSHKNVLH